jgi:hypothetical protein
LYRVLDARSAGAPCEPGSRSCRSGRAFAWFALARPLHIPGREGPYFKESVVKLKILVTSLVLGLSSVAFADHAEPASYKEPLYKEPLYGKPIHKEPNVAPFVGRDHRQIKWQTLAEGKRLMGMSTIRVRSRMAFDTLELKSTGFGMTFVDKVIVLFKDGSSQVVDLDKKLSARESLKIDLAGRNRQIAKVTLFGKSRGRAAVSLLGA